MRASDKNDTFVKAPAGILPRTRCTCGLAESIAGFWLTRLLPAVVQHLQVLEASGLVRSKKVGRARICRIEAKALRAAERWITEQRTSWERRLDRLGEYLADHADEPDQGNR